MAKLHRLAWVMFSALAWYACPAYGCRYNVREVGFIDVGIDPYRLVVFTDKTMSLDEGTRLKDLLDTALVGTNIRCEAVTAGSDANHPVLASVAGVPPVPLAEEPGAVLVSPDGQSMRLVLPPGGQSIADSVSSSLDAILNSPTCRQILERAADSYGVVLLIEGPQPDRNAVAREAASAAIKEIGEQLAYMPKPIAKGPGLVVLDQSSLAYEETLLWTLGLKPQDINEPKAAVFYGRGRWIGPLFKGQMLTSENLGQILSIIGADCECGLDHRQLQGTMLPARWDEELGRRVTRNLGFDPESPVVKMEMVSIVRRGMGRFNYPGRPISYRNLEGGGSVADSNMEPNHAIARGDSSILSPHTDAAQADTDSTQDRRGLSILATSVGGMILLVALASAVIVLRARSS